MDGFSHNRPQPARGSQPGVLDLVMGMVAEGTALCVCGNHDDKLARALAGRPLSLTQGLEVSLEQLCPPSGRRRGTS